MIALLPGSVRGRLWAALGLLSLAIVCISALTWLALQRVEDRLQVLHQQSLSEVAQAIDLSKRSSDLATSAPYLLNQRSNVLIQKEGAKLLKVLGLVRADWPTSTTTEADRNAVVAITTQLELGIGDLVTASQDLDDVQAAIRSKVAELTSLRETVTQRVEDQTISTNNKLIWWTLQSMNADALNASYADNLIGVGEEQRHYQRQRQLALNSERTVAQSDYLMRLERLVGGETGVFELRRKELGLNLDAQNALFRIRRDANRINELASDFAKRAEAVLIEERSASSATIQFTRISVAAISIAALLLALIAALYVSRYVAFNIGRVSEAMVRLAKGDRSSALPRRLGGADEIGDLFRSFRSFRANALRLDRSNRQLDQRNALFEKVFANITDGIAITDQTGRLTASNPAFGRILSVSEVDGNFVDWLYGSAFGRSAKDAKLTVAHRGHLVLEAEADGSQILELRASRLPDEGRVWLISDLTEQRKIAERVEQIDRIELLGKLAGDTAHDFANILSTIRTHAHLLGEDRNEDTRNLTAIENALDYGASLTDRLLAFARKQPLSPEVFDLNTLVEGMLELVEIGLKTGISLHVSPADVPLYVQADPGQLESAIFNLVLNSNHAMGDEGTVSIALSQNASGEAEVLVTDTGSGMSESVKAKAIQPFFTTRAGVGGTGLGLSIVYGFINQTGGRLEIESQENVGTSVTLTVPLAELTSASVARKITCSALVVDDDPKDRDRTSKVLNRLGYRTSTHKDAQTACEAIRTQEFDLIVSDFELAGEKTGLDVLSLAQKLKPEAKRILISGKTVFRSSKHQGVTVVEKPATEEKLDRAIEFASH